MSFNKMKRCLNAICLYDMCMILCAVCNSSALTATCSQVWVMDYIENFSCFQEFALQQDHFGHEQITIFVILCFRHRRAGEEV